MTRIVLTPTGTYGDMLPYLAIARCLRDRGHDAVIAGPATYRSLVETDGIEFHPVRPDIDYGDHDAWRRAMNRQTGGTVVIREQLLPYLRESYEDLTVACRGADLLVSHVLSYATPILGQKTGIPWVSSVLMPLSLMSAYDPPVIAAAPWFAHLRPLGPRVVGFIWRAMKSITRTWSKPIQDFRRELGLDEHPDPLWEGQFSPLGVLVLFSPILAPPQPDWPPQTTACGFPFYDGDFGGDPDAARLKEFLADGPPPLVFSLGSAAVPLAGDFYSISAAAARDLDRRAVLVVGDAGIPDELPQGVLAIRSATLGPLFAAASVIIHAGGVGTTGLAMRAGRPQLVVPFVHDQFDCALRVRRLGIGLDLEREHFTLARLRKALRRLDETPKIHSRTQAVADEVRVETGAESASEALERILAAS